MFQPGLKFGRDFMKFFGLPARDEIQRGQKPSPHVIATFISRGFLSEPGLKCQQVLPALAEIHHVITPLITIN